MLGPDVVSMTRDGSVQWKHYRERNGVFTFPADLPGDQVMRVHQALHTNSSEMVSNKGTAAQVRRFGQLALKRFRPWIEPETRINGRFENLRMNVSLSHALRDHPRITDSRWRLRGPEYYGAFITDTPGATVWAMEFIESRTLSEAMPTLPNRLAKHLIWHNLVGTLETALEGSGEEETVHIDHHNGNYLLPTQTLAALRDPTTDLELVRIDVGSEA